jgi:DNA-binding NtrC family response regulator
MPEPKQAILVIDDEDPVREMLLDYLREFKEFDEFELRGARSGEEALEMLRQRPAALCVVDLRLPGMSGADFTESAAAEKLCWGFIVHTGSGEFTLPRALFDLGMVEQDVFYKPVDMTEIVSRIRTLIKQRGDSHVHPGHR